MKNYIKPRLEIIDFLSKSFCVVTEVVSHYEVNDRLIIEIEDKLD